MEAYCFSVFPDKRDLGDLLSKHASVHSLDFSGTAEVVAEAKKAMKVF